MSEAPRRPGEPRPLPRRPPAARGGDPPARDLGRRAPVHLPGVAARARAAGRLVRRARAGLRAPARPDRHARASARRRPSSSGDDDGELAHRAQVVIRGAAGRGSRPRAATARRSTTPPCGRRRRTRCATHLEETAPRRARLEIGELLLAPGVPFSLDAGGFGRHTFLCGQSGSGKTYSLGVVLEQLLLETDLQIVVLDPNSDFVRLGRAAAGCGRRRR